MIDDEAEICSLTRSFLTRKNYDVLTAEDGPSALQAVKDEHPGLVLLDMRLGSSSGIEVLRKIKEFDKNIKVIMVTALDDEDSARQAKSLGAEDYIIKPFSCDSLSRIIAERLG